MSGATAEGDLQLMFAACILLAIAIAFTFLRESKRRPAPTSKN